MPGQQKQGVQRGCAAFPLQNYPYSLGMDVFCYTGRKEIPFRESKSLPPYTAQPSKSQKLTGEKNTEKIFKKYLTRVAF